MKRHTPRRRNAEMRFPRPRPVQSTCKSQPPIMSRLAILILLNSSSTGPSGVRLICNKSCLRKSQRGLSGRPPTLGKNGGCGKSVTAHHPTLIRLQARMRLVEKEHHPTSKRPVTRPLWCSLSEQQSLDDSQKATCFQPGVRKFSKGEDWSRGGEWGRCRPIIDAGFMMIAWPGCGHCYYYCLMLTLVLVFSRSCFFGCGISSSPTPSLRRPL